MFALLLQNQVTQNELLPIPNASQYMLYMVKACVYDSYYHERILS